MSKQGNNTAESRANRINYLLRIINASDSPTITWCIGQLGYTYGLRKEIVKEYLKVLESIGKIEIFDDKITSLCKPKTVPVDDKVAEEILTAEPVIEK